MLPRGFTSKISKRDEKKVRRYGRKDAGSVQDSDPRLTYAVATGEPPQFLPGEPFDVWRAVAIVERRSLTVEWLGCILPPQIVHKEEDDVGAAREG